MLSVSFRFVPIHDCQFGLLQCLLKGLGYQGNELGLKKMPESISDGVKTSRDSETHATTYTGLCSENQPQKFSGPGHVLKLVSPPNLMAAYFFVAIS